MWRDVARCSEMWRDVGRCGETWAAHDGREAMRDAERAPPPRCVVNRVLHLRRVRVGVGGRLRARVGVRLRVRGRVRGVILHLALRRAVEGGGGLVEHEHGGLAEQCARDAEPLLLAAAQPQAALADHGLEAGLQRGEVAVHPCEGAGGAELCGGRVAPGAGGGVMGSRDGLA